MQRIRPVLKGCRLGSESYQSDNRIASNSDIKYESFNFLRLFVQMSGTHINFLPLMFEFVMGPQLYGKKSLANDISFRYK